MKTIKKVFVLLTIGVMLSVSSCKSDDPDVTIGEKIITENITEDTTWESEFIYIIQASFDITNDATLTIEPGTIVKFNNGNLFSVSDIAFGNIKAIGTVDKPIIFTSNASSKSSGDWNGIWLHTGANASKFEYCVFEYAGGGSGWMENSGAINIIGGKNASIKNCTFKRSKGYGVRSYSSENAFSDFSENTFIDNDTNDLYLEAYNIEELGVDNTYSGEIDVHATNIEKTGEVRWKNQGTSLNFNGTVNVGSSSGTKLVIEPGCVLKFGSGGELTCGYYEMGIIEAIGTDINPITITSIANSPAEGDWNGISFHSNSSAGSIFEYCNVSYGGGAYNKGNFKFEQYQGPKVTINNCTISNSSGYGLYVGAGDIYYPTLLNNTFINNSLGDMNW